MSTRQLNFDHVVEFALRKEPSDGISTSEAAVIMENLDKSIGHLTLEFLSIGRDLHGVQTAAQHDSLNHAVLYLHLSPAGQVRFGMDNAENAPRRAVSPGILTVKFQRLIGKPHLSVMDLKCEWKNQGVIKTLRHFLVMIHLIEGSKFLMTEDHTGCRSWLQVPLCPELIVLR